VGTAQSSWIFLGLRCGGARGSLNCLRGERFRQEYEGWSQDEKKGDF
jgi:hypothetical protein